MPPKETETDSVHEQSIKSTEQSEHAEITKQRDEYLAGWQRAKADAVNDRKKFQDEMLNTRARTIIYCIEVILPLIDSIYFAKQSIQNDTDQQEHKAHKGILLMYTQAQQVAKELGVTFIDTVGVPFDASKHDIVNEIESSDVDSVLSIIRIGVEMDGRVIRPASVVIGIKKLT